jgi:hypothetical protein
MLIQSGLYYPYIHIRNDTWLKSSALYWKRMERIVPHDYPTQDSRTARMLKDELGFIEARRPGQAAVDTSRLFVDLLAERGRELAEQLQVQPSMADLVRRHERPRDGGLSARGNIGYIFAEKLSSELIEVMSAEGLAFGASGQNGERRRFSMDVGSASWIGMDSRLAATYMTVLTRLTARHFDLNPVTDVPIAHAAMDGLSVDAIADALIGQDHLSTDQRRIQFQQRVAMLAVQSVIPRSLGLVDEREIIRFRKQHEDELGAFQTAVSAAADEVASLPADIDAGTLRERVIEVTHQHLLKPRKELEAALRLFGLETVKSALTLQMPLIAGAGAIVGAATTPVIGTTTAAGAVLASFVGAEHSRRRALRNNSAAANYLMELRSGLTPKGVLQRQMRSVTSRQFPGAPSAT